MLTTTAAESPGCAEANPVAFSRAGGRTECLRCSEHAAGKQIEIKSGQQVFQTDSATDAVLVDIRKQRLDVVDPGLRRDRTNARRDDVS